MAFADRVLTLKLVTDVGDIAGGMKKTTKQLDTVDAAGKRVEHRFGRIGSKIKGFGGAIGNWGKAIGGALAIEGIQAVAGALDDAWDGFREGEKAAARLKGTFRNMGLSGGRATRAIDRIARSTKRLGTSDDEAVDAMGILVKTTKGDLPEAFHRLGIAQDLVANGSAPNLAAAIKIIDGAAKGSSKIVDKWGLDAKTASGRVDELGRSVKGAAKQKAAMDPLGTLFNAMAEDTESIVGSFAKGDFQGIVAGFQDLGTDIDNALFGKLHTSGRRDKGGIVDMIGGWGSKLATGISDAFDDIDWAKTIGDTLNTAFGAVKTAAENGTLGNIAIAGLAIGGILSAAMFTVSLFGSALGLVMGVLPFLASVAIAGAGALVGLLFRGAMFVVTEFATALAGVISSMAATSGVITAASAAGGIIGGIMAAGILTAGLAAIAFLLLNAPKGHAEIDPTKDPANRGPGYYNRVTGKWVAFHAEGTDHARAGWAVVGENGPELMRMRGGEQILPAGSWGPGDTFHITVQAGVGDPVAIGREVDRVLGAYRRVRGF